MTAPEPAWVPAFAGQRRPFAPGSAIRKTHGSRHPATVEPLADLVLQTAVEDAPWLLEPKYAATVRAWARAEAQAELLTTWLEQHGLHDDEGRLRPAESALHRAETRAANCRSRLGLDPISRARLGALAAASGPTILDVIAGLQAVQDDAGDEALPEGGGLA